jgi:hypothetical protein
MLQEELAELEPLIVNDDSVNARTSLDVLFSDGVAEAVLVTSKRRWIFDLLSGQQIRSLNWVTVGSMVDARRATVVRSVVGDHRVAFCGDLDPNDLAIALSLLEQGFDVDLIGITDPWLDRFEAQGVSMDRMFCTMSPYEQAVWKCLQNHGSVARLGLGPKCLAILNGSKTLDIDALVLRHWGEGVFNALRTLVECALWR